MSALVRLVLPDVEELLREGSPADVARAFEKFHAADLADVMELLEDEQAATLLLGLEEPQRTAAFELLESPKRQRIAEVAGAEALAPIVVNMSHDDRADFVTNLPEAIRNSLLRLLPEEEREDVDLLTTYEEDTAGGIMTSAYVVLDPDMTVSEAIERVRAEGEQQETIYALYVVDARKWLRGVVTMRQLILSPPQALIHEIMIKDPISISVDMDQERVVKLLGRYDFVAMPVIDARGRMLGIVTHDDALDVAIEEANEDAQLMGGLEPLDDPYLATALMTMIRKRAVWLSVLFVAGLFAGTILREFEATLQRAVALIFFLPLIIASGGNSGSQSATLVIRGLAVGEVKVTDAWRIARREMASGLILGTLLGSYGIGVSILWGLDDWQRIALTVSVTLIAIVTVGSLLGSLLPLLLQRIGIDPAITSAPLVACLVDIAGILIYVLVAGAFVPLLPT
ncbi:MAG: magnesium transporter [Planctomycetes bacterium]|nr:magnesium transporter [Planctomycetota bacterium]